MSDKNLTSMARALRRARLPVVRRNTQQPAPPPSEAPPEPGQPPLMYGKALDSWEPRFRPEVEEQAKEAKRPSRRQEAEVQKVPEINNEEDYVDTLRTGKRMVRTKVRMSSISISVSEEEARIIRQHVSGMQGSLSTWVRGLIFKAMGKRMPVRPKRP